jgi:predicted peptidase
VTSVDGVTSRQGDVAVSDQRLEVVGGSVEVWSSVCATRYVNVTVTRRRTALAMAAVALLLAACGGGGTVSDTAGDTPAAENKPVSQRFTPHPLGESGAPSGYYEYLPPGYGDGTPRPLLVFLHGFGENGDGSAELFKISGGGIPALISSDQWPLDRPFIVLAPQHRLAPDDPAYAPCDQATYPGSCVMKIQHEEGHPASGTPCATPMEVEKFLAYAVTTYDVDPNRVYLTGLSCGAYAAYEYVAEYGAGRVAAVVGIAGDARPAWATAKCKLGAVPIWAFHGDFDNTVAPAGSTEPMAKLAKCPIPPGHQVKITTYADAGHDSWTRTYDLSAGHDIYAWLLGFARP